MPRAKNPRPRGNPLLKVRVIPKSGGKSSEMLMSRKSLENNRADRVGSPYSHIAVLKVMSARDVRRWRGR